MEWKRRQQSLHEQQTRTNEKTRDIQVELNGHAATPAKKPKMKQLMTDKRCPRSQLRCIHGSEHLPVLSPFTQLHPLLAFECPGAGKAGLPALGWPAHRSSGLSLACQQATQTPEQKTYVVAVTKTWDESALHSSCSKILVLEPQVTFQMEYFN